MKLMEQARNILKKMEQSGFDHSLVDCTLTSKTELNIDRKEISLLRNSSRTKVVLEGIRNQKHASISVSDLEAGVIDKAIKDLSEMAETSPPDEAWEMVKDQPAEHFVDGPQDADLDLMYNRADEFLKETAVQYEGILFNPFVVDHVRKENALINSNQVELTQSKGIYSAGGLFSTKKGRKVSSFNYAGFSRRSLDKSLLDGNLLSRLMKQNGEQIVTRKIPGKFRGDILITPEALGDFIDFIEQQISTLPLMNKTSLYFEKTGEKITSELLTIDYKPLSMDAGYRMTAEGLIVQESRILDKGVLKHYLLGTYGAKKTGFDRSVNMGRTPVVEAGQDSFEEMVSSIQEGIILGRISGGMPAKNGDFSAVAKNSYYVKDGVIQYPLGETMITGNMAAILQSINMVSRERVDNGSAVRPWVKAAGVIIS